MPQTGHPGLWQEEMRSGTEAKERHGTPTSLKRHTSDKESPLQQLCYNHNVHQPTVLDPQRGHPSALLVSGREQDVRGGLPGISSPRPLPRPAGSSGSRVPSPQVGRLGSCTCSQGPEGRVLQGGVSGAEEAQDLYPGPWCWGRGGGGVHQGVFRPRGHGCPPVRPVFFPPEGNSLLRGRKGIESPTASAQVAQTPPRPNAGTRMSYPCFHEKHKLSHSRALRGWVSRGRQSRRAMIPLAPI